MGRKSTIWRRKGRGWFTVIAGQQIPLGHDKAAATKLFHRLMASAAPKRAAKLRPGQHSLPILVAKYLNWIIGRDTDPVKPVTHETYRESLQLWVDAYGDLNPSDLRGYHLTDWLDDHPTWNSSTKHNRGCHVKLWSSWAEAQGYLEGDRLRSAKIPSMLTREAAPDGHIARLAAAIAPGHFLDYFLVLWDTGARPGEISSLSADRCNLEGRAAVVLGKKGPRPIGLTPRAADILRKHALTYPEGPILRTRHGSLWNDDNRYRQLRRWNAVAKTRVCSYSLRHDLAPRWRAMGIDELTLAKQIGHYSRAQPHLAMLASNYAHISAPELAQAANQASSPRPAKRGRGASGLAR